MDIIATPRNIIKNANLLPYISILIKEQRNNLGLSQEELSKKIGFGLKTLRKIEQGNLNVNFNKLNYLLNFLGMSLKPSELITSPQRKKKILFKQDYILKLLRHLSPIFEIKYGVSELSLFGSYAKGQASPDSDIDILIDFESEISFETEGEIQLILENVFQGAKVDLTLKNNLHHAFVNEIEESKIDVT
jgi:predicted nucleotidyltransferase/DNA-binding XRE family transcriptional regulator